MDPYALGLAGLTDLLADQPGYRARQVHAWLARGVDDPREMTDLPAPLRERLAGTFDPPPDVLRHRTADRGLTHKVLLRTAAGEAVESVLMLYPRSGRATVCISTQAGCAMGCPFCATGQAGFRGQLGVGEIVRQVTVMQRMLARGEIPADGGVDHVTNVVFMGMGEPLANLDATVAAIRWLHDPGWSSRAGRAGGFNLSARSITVSTVGLVPGIRRLAHLGLPLTLAVSLHAPEDALRDDLVPVNRQHPLGDLLDACRLYLAMTGRRLTFEYILIDGINADVEHAAQLAGLVADLRCHVNLIPYNPTPAVPWACPPAAQQEAFARVLDRRGIPVTVRRNRGGDIEAACGQLYADYAIASGRMLPGAQGAAQRVEARR
jgi:23S rRNA (adenine2503-C2)-methyltransferase